MTIDGNTIQTPTELKLGVFRISKSERLASGKMAMEIIAVKRRLDLTYAIITAANLKTIMDALDGTVFHTVVYPDPQSGEATSITAYAGDVSNVAGQKIGGTRYYQDVSISLIEQ